MGENVAAPIRAPYLEAPRLAHRLELALPVDASMRGVVVAPEADSALVAGGELAAQLGEHPRKGTPVAAWGRDQRPTAGPQQPGRLVEQRRARRHVLDDL